MGISKIKLREHQRKVVNHIIKPSVKGLLCLHSTGSGKSFTAIACAQELLQKNIINKVVVLVKKTILIQFKKEMEKYNPELLKNTNIIVNTIQTFFKENDLKNNVSNSQNTFLIVDEAHEFVNQKAKYTYELFEYAKSCKKLLFLTATIYKNKYEDLIPVFSLIKNYDTFIPSNEFISMLLNKSKNAFFKDTVSYYLIDKNNDVNYPKVVYHDISLTMNDETVKRFIEFERNRDKKPFYTEERQLSLGYQDSFKIVDTNCTYIDKCFLDWDPEKENLILKEKCEKCEWLIRNLNKWLEKKEDKILIYTSFIDSGTEILKKMLLNEGVNYLVIDGETTSIKVKKILNVYGSSKSNPNSSSNSNSNSRKKKLIKTSQMGGKSKIQSVSKVAKVDIKKSLNSIFLKKNFCGKEPWFIRRTLDAKNKNMKKRYNFFDSKFKKLDEVAVENIMQEMKVKQYPPIPPAWTPAYVCRPNTGNVLWYAKDSKDRWQRRYTFDWEEVEREKKKINVLKEYNQRFWVKFTNVINNHISHIKWDTNKLCAMAIKLISKCYFRVGGRNDDEDKHYGTSSLQVKHFKVIENTIQQTIQIKFEGKSGKQNYCTIHRKPKENNSSFISDLKHELFFDNLKLLLKNKKRNDKVFSMNDISIDDDNIRNYLKRENLHELRPKDFRTYFANWKLLNVLLKKNIASQLSEQERKKNISDAVIQISKELNNTPQVAKSSYVFSALWILYITSPYDFDKLMYEAIKMNKSTNTANILNYMNLHFLKENTNWKRLIKTYKDNFGLLTFTNKEAPVLIITNAGAESLDLKGVRHLVLVDSIWHSAIQEQIIGRSQRYHSHHHLPINERKVHIWKLILDYPKHLEKESPERSINNVLLNKKKQSHFLYDLLKKNSI
tara:strand:- start:1509 stop:4184 length:2676 start_codon:yes stop_codon:yes gene_type:complete